MENLVIVSVDPTQNAEAQQLIRQLDHELRLRYPGNTGHPLDLSQITAPNGLFLVGYLNGQPVACGAVRQIEPQVGELKRVFVAAPARRLGVAKLMINRLEQESLRFGFKILRLETGRRQPEALNLYRRLGYVDIPQFGEYHDDPYSVCMEKILR